MAIKLTKAIEILKIDLCQNSDKINNDLHDARCLALMELEVIDYVRKGHSWHPMALLPGEMPPDPEDAHPTSILGKLLHPLRMDQHRG